jgi:hypothetical protein
LDASFLRLEALRDFPAPVAFLGMPSFYRSCRNAC